MTSRKMKVVNTPIIISKLMIKQQKCILNIKLLSLSTLLNNCIDNMVGILQDSHDPTAIILLKKIGI